MSRCWAFVGLRIFAGVPSCPCVQSPAALVLSATGAQWFDSRQSNLSSVSEATAFLSEFNSTQKLSSKEPSAEWPTVSIRELTDKPRSDHRTYKYVTLANGLQVLTVQDEKSSDAAISVAVEAGSYDDPSDLPGLAHFCEHALFLGSAHFPKADEIWDAVVDANAYTANERTVFFAALPAGAIDGGLVRFADMMQEPLFDRNSLDREVNAIDSEHAKNIQDSNSRTNAIISSIANPRSPYSWFKTGSKQTLSAIPKAMGIDVVSRLKVWFKTHYCPSRMRLATFGPDNHTVQLTRASYFFEHIQVGTETCVKPRKSRATPLPWPASHLGKMVVIKGTEATSELWIHFPLPDIRKFYKSNPLAYLSYVLTYGGPQSIFWLLRNKLSLVTSFDFTSNDQTSGLDIFLVAYLTPRGREHLKLVLNIIFHYLAVLKRLKINRPLYKSLAAAYALQWEWGSPAGAEDTASGLASSMIETPMPDLLTAGSRIDMFNVTLLSELMSWLRPSNMNIILVDPHADKTFFPGHQILLVQPHYNASYVVFDQGKTLPVRLWKSWLENPQVTRDSLFRSDEVLHWNSTANWFRILEEAHLILEAHEMPLPPLPIWGVPSPKSLSLVYATANRSNDETAGPAERLYGASIEKVRLTSAPLSGQPRVVGDFTPEFWYRGGWLTPSPKIKIAVMFAAPQKLGNWEENPQYAFWISIYTQLLGEAMDVELNDLTMTGVNGAVDLARHHLIFSFSGFSPRMADLVNKMISTFKQGVNLTGNARYNSVIESMKLSLKKYDGEPVDGARSDLVRLLTPGTSSREEQLEILDGITPEDVASVPSNFIFQRPVQLFGLAMGNMPSIEAQGIFKKFQDYAAATWTGIRESSAGDEELFPAVPIVRPGRPVQLRQLNPRLGDGNDVLALSLLIGPLTVKSRLVHALLESTLSGLVFAELRTKRELGYVASGSISVMSNIAYASCVVQGERERADKVEWGCEHVFMHLMPEALNNMSDADVVAGVKSLEAELLAPPESLNDEFGHFWSSIMPHGVFATQLGDHFAGNDCTNLADTKIKYLRDANLSKQTLIDAWNAIVFPESGIRNKVVVKYFANEVPPIPSLEQTRAMWAMEELPTYAFNMLENEYESSVVLDKANSKTRKELTSMGSYFSTDLHCNNEVENESLIQNQCYRGTEAHMVLKFTVVIKLLLVFCNS